MLPKKRRSFPKVGQLHRGPDCYASIIGKALRTELGGSHQCVKTIMKWTGAKERTIENWLVGANGPGAGYIHSILATDIAAYARRSDEPVSTAVSIVTRRAS